MIWLLKMYLSEEQSLLFWWSFSPSLHCVICRQLWKDESPEYCAADLLHTREGTRGLYSFLSLAVNIIKQIHPAPMHSSVQRVGMHTFGYKLSYVLPLKYIWKWIFLTKMVNCSKLHIYKIATIAYFLRFLTLFFDYVIIITKSMYHIC